MVGLATQPLVQRSAQTLPETADGGRGRRSGSVLDSAPTPAVSTIAPCGVVEDRERDALFQDFQPLVRRLIAHYGEDPELREELPGEIYCRFCRLLKDYDPDRGVPLSPYLIRKLTVSVYSFARSHWRHRNRECHLDPDFVCPSDSLGEDANEAWAEQVLNRQVLEKLPSAIADLPPRQREVLIGRYYEGRSSQELAQTLGIQTATIRAITRQALKGLRRRLFPADCGVRAKSTPRVRLKSAPVTPESG